MNKFIVYVAIVVCCFITVYALNDSLSSTIFTIKNASVGGKVINIESPSDNVVNSVYVEKGEFVKKGQKLLQIGYNSNSFKFELIMETLKATIDDELVSCFDESILMEQLQINTLKLKNQQKQFKRLEHLANIGVVDQVVYDDGLNQLNVLKHSKNEIQYNLKKVRFKNYVPILDRPSIQEKIIEGKDRYRQLRISEIIAPTDGYIYEVYKQASQYSEEGGRLLTFIPHNGRFIEANILEINLNNIKVGMPVKIIPDYSLGEKVYSGKIQSIVPSIAASFSPMPKNNLDSNWIKTSQRIPVIIKFDEKYPSYIPIGSSVKVVIDESDKIAINPQEKSMFTGEFDVSMQDIEENFDQLLEDVISNQKDRISKLHLASCQFRTEPKGSEALL